MSFINKSVLSALFRGYKTTFARSLNTGEPILWDRVAQLVNSTGSGENYGWIGESPALRKWVGPRQARKLATHKYTIDNDPYEGTIEVNRTDIEDDTLGVYDMQAAQIGAATRRWPDEVVFAALEAGDSTVCYDDQYFFDTEHLVGRAEDGSLTTYSNLTDDGGANAAHPYYLFDTTKMVKPLIWQLRKPPEFVSLTNLNDANVFFQNIFYFGVYCRGNAGYGLPQCAQRCEGALSESVVKANILTMNAITNDEGRNMGINPNIIMVPLTHQFTVNEVVKRVYEDADFTPNPLQRLEVIVNPMLT
jgi:phage major head subunit gpT-like protein